MKIRTCEVCGTELHPGNRSEEHFYRREILRRLGLEGSKCGNHVEDEVKDRRWMGIASSNVVKGICRSCNKDFNRFDQPAEELIVKLAKGTKDFRRLRDAQCNSLARWAVKTACLIDLLQKEDRRRVSRQFWDFVRDDGELPSGVLVTGLLHQMEGQKDNPCGNASNGYFHIFPELQPDVADYHDFEASPLPFKIGIRYLRFHIMVAYCPAPGWGFSVTKGLHDWKVTDAPIVLKDAVDYPPIDLMDPTLLNIGLWNIGFVAPSVIWDLNGLPIAERTGILARPARFGGVAVSRYERLMKNGSDHPIQ